MGTDLTCQSSLLSWLAVESRSSSWRNLISISWLSTSSRETIPYAKRFFDAIDSSIQLLPLHFSNTATMPQINSPLWFTSAKSYVFVRLRVTWLSVATTPLSRSWVRYSEENLQWYNWNRVWLLNTTNAWSYQWVFGRGKKYFLIERVEFRMWNRNKHLGEYLTCMYRIIYGFYIHFDSFPNFFAFPGFIKLLWLSHQQKHKMVHYLKGKCIIRTFINNLVVGFIPLIVLARYDNL